MGRTPTNPERIDEAVLARFWCKVEKSDDCWLWTAKRNQLGYGKFAVTSQREVYAQRFAWEAEHGPVPAVRERDHLCRNRACVNPAHMEPVTHRENVRRGAHVNRATCANGHPYTPENVRITASGARRCRACDRERAIALRDGRVPPASYRRAVPRQEVCKRGHPFDSANTMISGGVRYCRACAYERKRRNRRAITPNP